MVGACHGIIVTRHDCDRQIQTFFLFKYATMGICTSNNISLTRIRHVIFSSLPFLFLRVLDTRHAMSSTMTSQRKDTKKDPRNKIKKLNKILENSISLTKNKIIGSKNPKNTSTSLFLKRSNTMAFYRSLAVSAFLASLCGAETGSIRNQQQRRLSFPKISGLYEPATAVVDHVSRKRKI